MDTWVKRIGATLAVLAMFGAAWTTIDAHFARAADLRAVQSQIAEVKVLYLQSERRELLRQKFELEVAQQMRRLTPLETKRLRDLVEELAEIEKEILRLHRP